MQIIIAIEKVDENGAFVIYQFDEEIKKNSNSLSDNSGIIRLNKRNGNCRVLRELVGDSNQDILDIVYRNLLKHWRNGQYPDKTESLFPCTMIS